MNSMSFLMMWIFGSSFSFPSASAAQEIKLEEALLNKSVTMEAKGLGGHSGEAISLSLTNTSGKALSVKIPAGSVFHPEDESMQDIFVVQDQILALAPKGKKTMNVSGFCCQASDRSPQANIGFTYASHPNPKLIELATFLNGKSFSNDVLQNAVWCISDNHRVSNIWAEDRATVQPLRDLICKITGKKDVWYSSETNVTIEPDGHINLEAVSVNGAIGFDLKKPSTITASVKATFKDFKYDIPSKLNLPKAGHYEYDFNLRVRGWEKGKYVVIIMEGTRELMKTEFEV